MNRRELLVVGCSVAASGGCLGGVPAVSSSDSEHSFPEVTADPDTVTSDRDAAIDVTVSRQFSASVPVRIRIGYTNTASTEREVIFGTSVPFPPYSGERVDGPGRLSLVPDDREFVGPHPRPETDASPSTTTAGDPFVPAGPTGDCWRALASVAGADVARRRVLGPDETVAGTCTVLAHSDSTTCLAAGTYRFEDGRYFGDGRSWGFALGLAR